MFGIERPTAEEHHLLSQGGLDDHNMYWAWSKFRTNFGDWIGPYLYLKKTGVKPRLATAAVVKPPRIVHFTCGSILQQIQSPDVAIVWGSGIMDFSRSFARPKEIHAVRGPLTQKRLEQMKYDVPDVLGDPGICMPKFYSPKSREKKYRIGIISHVVDTPFWRSIEKFLPEGVKVIYLNGRFDAAIDDIAACEFTVSSSLHGVIISHAYGVPSAWADSCTRPLAGDGTKFADYFQSVGLDLTEADRVSIRLPFRPEDYRDAASFPPVDMGRMADRLLEACPF
ncbi:polysaccharide pyruvyl transferase family protein [Paracoccus sp. NGMCC 1.201697]|uniref:Polysaccharide pyruvyl transferase family protein n=1 Tax=Paracoccus broussonetiae subsp. drimophilus TaxID=3373869 RepID=A0ABW7LSN2_9RHOB